MRYSILFILLIVTLIGNSQVLSPTKLMIPTSNGDSLEADLYLPNLTDTFPTILIQTPYGKFGYWFSISSIVR